MRQHHPLENPSLAPYGFAFPNRRKRLEYVPEIGGINAEKIIARMWDRRNRANAAKPLPIESIIHEILPSQATANRIAAGDFMHNGLPYLTRDILLISSTIQWLGTNCGNWFLEEDISRELGFHPEREFLMKCERSDARRNQTEPSMALFLTHSCTERCRNNPFMPFQSCHYDNPVSERDRAVINGLMRWLGKPPGRGFIAEYLQRRKNAFEAARSPEEKQLLKKLRVA